MSSDRTVSRRDFLRVSGAVGAVLALSACGAAPQPVAAPSSGGVKDSANGLPNFFPQTTGPKPDYHSSDNHIDDGFDAYPANPRKALPNEPPGAGGTVSILMRTYGSTPPTPFDQNPTWQEINKQLNARVQISLYNQADYATKLATAMAGNDLPDIIHLFGALNAAPALPEFFKAKCADLTPYLSGDAARDYPNLAAIPTYAWQNTNSAINGHLYQIPIQRYLPGGTFLYKQSETWNKVIGQGTNPRNSDDLMKMYKQLNSPSSGVYAVGDFWSFNMYGVNGYAQIFGAPNTWRLEKDGNLTKDWETEEFKAAVGFVRDLWANQLIHPDSAGAAGANVSRDGFVAGKFVTTVELYGNGWVDFWRRGLQQKPPLHFELVPPFAYDGGKPITYLTGGYIST
ncbi:MAG: extracellular solute-binding protein, partial [Chloroflexi bacterium]|nr:extracellular solute-binding protein [Chloroflexota bacterium]